MYSFTANNRIVSGVSYDDAGNITYDGSYYYKYDGNNKVIAVGTTLGGSNVATYAYNSRGMRVSTTASGSTVDWMFDLGGNALTASIPGTTQFYQAEYFVGGRDWGTLRTDGVNFRYPDWVGNGRVWQNVAGTVTQQAAYAAFGDGLFAPGGGSCCVLGAGMFDGAWQDSGNNTYHTLNREYSPTQGRWLTPDPGGLAVMDPSNPQTWNRYAYVANNPLSFTDPTGLVRTPWGTFGGTVDFLGTASGFDLLGIPVANTGGTYYYDGPHPEGTETGFDLFGGQGATSGGGTCYYVLANPCGVAANNGNPQTPPQTPKPQQPCYSGNSFTDKTVRFFSLLRLPETWREWVVGGAAKVSFFGAAQAGARSAGGAESLGAAALGTGAKILGSAGTAAMIGATMADFNCQIGPVDPYTEK